MLDHMKAMSTTIETAALVALVGFAAAGVHYDGIWGGVAAFSAALLVVSMVHTVLLGVVLRNAERLIRQSLR